MNRLALLAVVCSLALAGCLSGAGPGTATSPEPTATPADTATPPTASPARTSLAPTTDSPTPSPSPTAPLPQSETPIVENTTDCGNAWVGFWGLGGDDVDQFWDPDRMRVGYTLPANASVHLVAVERGTVLGADHVAPASSEGDGTPMPIHADGDEVTLDSSLSGRHTVRVVMVDDANGNGEFDDGDAACTSDDDLVSTDWETLDFDQFTGGSTATESASTAN